MIICLRLLVLSRCNGIAFDFLIGIVRFDIVRCISNSVIILLLKGLFQNQVQTSFQSSFHEMQYTESTSITIVDNNLVDSTRDSLTTSINSSSNMNETLSMTNSQTDATVDGSSAIDTLLTMDTTNSDSIVTHVEYFMVNSTSEYEDRTMNTNSMTTLPSASATVSSSMFVLTSTMDSMSLSTQLTIDDQTSSYPMTTSNIESNHSPSHDILYEYCREQQCQHGGRLNTDCLCICLPAYTGKYCETGR
jgi:hypothetical protein